MTLVMNSISNAFASSVRHDSGDDSTQEEHNCWINGYDSGFTGKYDSDRARECKEHSDNYNQMWAEGCGNAVLTAEECGDLQSYIVYIGNVEYIPPVTIH